MSTPSQPSNNEFSVSGTLHSAQGLVYALISALTALILLGIVCAGTANLGGGKIIGSIAQSSGKIGADAWRTANNMKDDEPIDLLSKVPFQVVGKDQPVVPQQGQPAQPAQPVVQPQKANPEDEKRQQQVNQQLLDTAKYWQSTGNWDVTNDKLAAVAGMMKANESYPLYDKLSAEVLKVKTAASRVLPDYEAYKKAGSDLSAKYTAVQQLRSDSSTVYEFLNTNGLTMHVSYKIAKTALELSDKALRIMDAYRAALKADTPQFTNTVSEAWSGTKWKVIEFDDRMGSCKCALIEAMDESVKGLHLTVPADAVKKFSKGVLQSYVGKIITFK